MFDQDLTESLQQEVTKACQQKQPLDIRGHGSKLFYGRRLSCKLLDVSEHTGVLNYQPQELVITARCGTKLTEVEATLENQGQMLPFEPPHFGEDDTLGGAIACGLSGPRRSFYGSTRDFVLGVTMLNGRGEVLRFGGEVMKNVAGYDISRLMAGSMGTLGVILDVSVKVLPKPESEASVRVSCDCIEAVQLVNQWMYQGFSVSGTFHDGVHLFIRLSGSTAGVDAALTKMRGEQVESEPFWSHVRDHRHAFFQQNNPLWRISLPADAPALLLKGPQCLEWNGALRWLISDEAPEAIRDTVAQLKGHATLFRGGDPDGERFHPLSDGMLALHQNLKRSFDQHAILNPGRMYKQM